MAQQLLLDILPPSQPTFDNLIVGDNGATVQATRDLQLGQTIYLWGPDGSGRSHLLKAAASHYSGHYVETGPNQADQITSLVEQLAKPATCIAVDDVHKMTEPELTALFRLYNRWRESAASDQAFRLIVAGSLAPLQMKIREDVRTRLGWGGVYRLMPLTDGDKLKALRSFAQSNALPLSEDVLSWLLTYGSRDIRVLFGILDSLDRYGLEHHRPLTLPLLKSMLADNQDLFS